MRRFLSWVVLTLGSVFMCALCYTLTMLFINLLGAIEGFSTALYILILLCAGSFLIFVLLIPFILVLPALIKSSETVCPSIKGTRYIVLSVIIILNSIINMFLYGVHIPYVYNAIFFIVMFLTYKKYLGETY